jgi:hypothetical protein
VLHKRKHPTQTRSGVQLFLLSLEIKTKFSKAKIFKNF